MPAESSSTPSLPDKLCAPPGWLKTKTQEESAGDANFESAIIPSSAAMRGCAASFSDSNANCTGLLLLFLAIKRYRTPCLSTHRAKVLANDHSALQP